MTLNDEAENVDGWSGAKVFNVKVITADTEVFNSLIDPTDRALVL